MALNISKLNKPKPSSKLNGIGIPKMSKEEKEKMRAEFSSSKPTEEKPVEVTNELDAISKDYKYETIEINRLEAAPEEWNFFKQLSEKKGLDLAISIHTNGLLQPIIVRALDNAGKKYQILAGHSRVRAYKLLYELFEEEKYLNIEAIVYDYDKLNDLKAREVIIDTNLMQRGSLPSSEMARCISEKVQLLKAQNVENITAVLTEKYDIKKTSLFMWNRLANLIDPFKEIMNEKKLTLKNCYKLSQYTANEQENIYMKVGELLTDGIMAKVKKNTTATQLIAIAKEGQDEIRSARFTFPASKLKSDKDIAKLIYVSPDKLSKFEELITSFDGAYIIEN